MPTIALRLRKDRFIARHPFNNMLLRLSGVFQKKLYGYINRLTLISTHFKFVRKVMCLLLKGYAGGQEDDYRSRKTKPLSVDTI